MIISVGGAHSRVGKTALCSILLRGLKGFGAIKFTKTRLYTSIVDDLRILTEPGKDTAIFLESGAEKVVWIRCPQEALAYTIPIALSKMSELHGIIVEGNSPVDFLNPDLVIFIMDIKGEVKPSAIKVSRRADIIVINPKEAVSHLVREGADVFWIDLQEKKGDIDEFLLSVKKRIKDLH